MEKDTCLKLGRFITALHAKIQCELKSIKFRIDLKPKKRTKKDTTESNLLDDIDKPLSQEQWRNKEPKRLRSGNLFTQMDKQFNTQETSMPIPKEPSQPILPHDVACSEPSTSGEIECKAGILKLPNELCLKNGLYFNNDYYLSSAFSTPYSLGEFKINQHKFVLKSGDYKRLISSENQYMDFQSLPDNARWLSDDCLDAAAACFFKHPESECYYVECFASQMLFFDARNIYSNLNALQESFDNKKFIIIPYNLNGNHWTVIVLDIAEQCIYYVNPLQPSENETNNIFQIMKKFFSVRNIHQRVFKMNIRKWKLIVLEGIPRQKNGVNCGVFVCYYLEIISKLDSMDGFLDKCDENFNLEIYRIHLQKKYLLCCEDVTQRCQVCGSHTQAK